MELPKILTQIEKAIHQLEADYELLVLFYGETPELKEWKVLKLKALAEKYRLTKDIEILQRTNL